MIDQTSASNNIKYNIKYSQRKTLALHINYQGLEVRAPEGIAQHYINEFIERKKHWINKTLAKSQQRQREKFAAENNRLVPIQGQMKRIQLRSASSNQCFIEQETLICAVKPGLIARHSQHNLIKSRLTLYLKELAQQSIPARIQFYAAQLGVADKISDIRYRKTKTKWGHCSSQGQLQFNWLLMKAPQEVLDYVICHEVCHLLEMNHSPGFWQLVAQLCPDFQSHQQWLTTQGHRLSFL